jgi:hypothetical protein
MPNKLKRADAPVSTPSISSTESTQEVTTRTQDGSHDTDVLESGDKSAALKGAAVGSDPTRSLDAPADTKAKGKISKRSAIIVGAAITAVCVGLAVTATLWGPAAVHALAASSVGGPVALGICAGCILVGGLASYALQRINKARANREATEAAPKGVDAETLKGIAEETKALTTQLQDTKSENAGLTAQLAAIAEKNDSDRAAALAALEEYENSLHMTPGKARDEAYDAAREKLFGSLGHAAAAA